MNLKDTSLVRLASRISNKLLLALALSIFAMPAFAQTARVQVIHNSPYAAAATVDIFINGDRALNDVDFRTATGFLDLPAGVEITIDVTAPDAADNTTPVFSKTIDAPGLTADATYLLVAAGDPTGGMPAFDIFINDMGQEAAEMMGNVEFQVFHGSPDAPTVDVAARGITTLVDDIAFGSFAPAYLSVGPEVYDIDINTADGSATAYSAVADLSGAADGALVVLASGFLMPEEGAPGFGLLAVFPDGTTALLPENIARAQIIHNSPYAAASMVDVYINDVRTLDDFEFQEATEFLSLPAAATSENSPPIKIDITGAMDADNSMPVFWTTVSLIEGTTYILTAAGDPVGGDPAFGLYINDMGQETGTDPEKTDVLVFHGSPDAPTVDVTALGSPRPIVDNAAFGDYAGYVSLLTDNYTLNVTGEDNNDAVVASFSASLAALELDGAAIVVQASGFLAPEMDQPGFGLIAVTAAGGVVPLEAATDARVQVIHNSADPGAGSVDIYVSQDGTELAKLDDVSFRTATEYLTLPAGEITIDIAPPTSADASESIFTKVLPLNAGETYVAMASGSLSAMDETAFNIFASFGREVSAQAGGADLLIFHGATDAPAVDVTVPGVLSLVDNASFGGFVPYQSVGLADYALDLLTADSTTLVAQYTAPLETLGLADQALVVAASGFLAPATMDDPAFGLYAVLASGGAFVELPVTSGVANEDLDASVPGEFVLYENYPNPFNPTTTLLFDLPEAASVTVQVFDMLGRQVMSIPAESRAAGASQRIQLDASSLASGLYLYQVSAQATANNYISTGRMILIK